MVRERLWPICFLGPDMIKFAPNFCYCAVDQEKAVFKRKRAVSGPSQICSKFLPNMSNAPGPARNRETLRTARIGPGEALNWCGSCRKIQNWSGVGPGAIGLGDAQETPELVRAMRRPRFWPGPGISLGNAQNSQNWSGKFPARRGFWGFPERFVKAS